MGDISHESAGTDGKSELTDAGAMLHPLADELLAIAGRLRNAAEGAPVRSEGGALRAIRPSRSHLALARMVYNLRRKRATLFGNHDLFGEPAWDILLDLFIAHSEGKPVSVSSACIGSASPPTTGLRWLGVLADEGLVVRENDPEDHRRVMVRLTRAGITAMERFFDALEAGG